jgi:2-oxo-3-hexenedioate decarboxylase
MSLAQGLLRAADAGTGLDPARFPLADAAAGQALQDAVSALRQARGERPLGWKIGFTNRSIWPLYGVSHPIRGPLWHTTVTQLEGTLAELRPARWAEPRLEPEIVFGLAASPEHADPDHVLGCIGWMAHGFEVVTSPWPDWRFSAAQAIAAQGLHGALLIGPRRPCPPADGAALAGLTLHLSCNDAPVATGHGSAVLDGPVQALSHLVGQALAEGWRLPVGAIVTTGTLTDAQPLAPGQHWRTRIEGIDLPGLALITHG